MAYDDEHSVCDCDHCQEYYCGLAYYNETIMGLGLVVLSLLVFSLVVVFV